MMINRCSRWVMARLVLLAVLPGFAAADAPSDRKSATPDDDYTYIGESVASRASWPSSSAWGLVFRQTVAPHFGWSLAYLNDGHFPLHHRDGVTAEAWVPITLANDHLTVSIGAGPFYYFDTENSSNTSGYADVHGWAWMLSADARWSLWSRVSQPGWFLDLRYDWSAPAHDIETHSIGGGIGYRMYSDFTADTPGQNSPAGFSQNEIIAYLGKTVVNSFSSQHTLAESVEYRRQLLFEFTRLSLAFVNEGNAQLIRRNGLIYEGWLEPSFWDGNASVGAGWGGYTAVDKYQPTPGRHVSFVVSATLSARPLNLIPALRGSSAGQQFNLRVTWHRIVTDYNRDTDILLFGAGYRF
jgi:hypothetical protein